MITSRPHDWDLGDGLDEVVDRLCAQFHEIPRAAVVSVVADSQRTVADAAGSPDPHQAERLARLRLHARLREGISLPSPRSGAGPAIEVHDEGDGTICLRLHGEIDLAVEQGLDRSMHMVLTARPRLLRIDLGDVTFLSVHAAATIDTADAHVSGR